MLLRRNGEDHSGGFSFRTQNVDVSAAIRLHRKKFCILRLGPVCYALYLVKPNQMVDELGLHSG